jgi:hypothetical protein
VAGDPTSSGRWAVEPIAGANTFHAVACASPDTCVSVDSAGYGYLGKALAPSPPAVPPTDTGAPAISGNAQVGQTLDASTGTWSGTTPISYTYQWQRCSEGTCTDIGQATRGTYFIARSDLGHNLRVVVDAENSAGTGSAMSPSVGAVAPSAAQTTAWLLALLVPSKSADRIATMLKSHGCKLTFAPFAQGALKVTWYQAASATSPSLARADVLVASATESISGGRGTLKLELTRAGRRLLEHSKRVTLVADGEFKPAGEASVTAQRTLRVSK